MSSKDKNEEPPALPEATPPEWPTGNASARPAASLFASAPLLESLPLDVNSEDFVFDNQILAQAHLLGARLGEISCPARYFPEASSINFRRSVTYGFGVLKTSITYRLAKWGLYRAPIFRFPQRELVLKEHTTAQGMRGR